MARADFHTHTRFSPDGLTRPEQFVQRCVARGMDIVAVTDHGTVDGARAVAALAPFAVIIGQEVRTRDGELLGLYLEESIPKGLSGVEAAQRIHAQGGLVVAPHPFARLRPALRARGLRTLAGLVDAIEGYNGRMLWPGLDRQARHHAAEQDLPCTLGSDAHTPPELGRSYVELPDFDGPAELLQALRQARYHLAPPAPWWLPLSGLALAAWALGQRPRAAGQTGRRGP